MLADSGLLNDLQRFAYSTTGQPMCLYGDPAYPLRIHLQAPFRNAVLTPAMQAFNSSMSAVRESVEWLFGDIVNYFKFMDFHKNLKIGLWGKCILSVLSFAMPILAVMAIKLQSILIWSPQPLKSILFRIPLGAHLFTNQYNIFRLKSKRVFNHRTSKCKKRKGDVKYTVSF